MRDQIKFHNFVFVIESLLPPPPLSICWCSLLKCCISFPSSSSRRRSPFQRLMPFAHFIAIIRHVGMCVRPSCRFKLCILDAHGTHARPGHAMPHTKNPFRNKMLVALNVRTRAIELSSNPINIYTRARLRKNKNEIQNCTQAFLCYNHRHHHRNRKYSECAYAFLVRSFVCSFVSFGCRCATRRTDDDGT